MPAGLLQTTWNDTRREKWARITTVGPADLYREHRCPRNSEPVMGWCLLPQCWKAVRLGPLSMFGAGILFAIPRWLSCLRLKGLTR